MNRFAWAEEDVTIDEEEADEEDKSAEDLFTDERLWEDFRKKTLHIIRPFFSEVFLAGAEIGARQLGIGEKANPNHDARGRFARGSGVSSSAAVLTDAEAKEWLKGSANSKITIHLTGPEGLIGSVDVTKGAGAYGQGFYTADRADRKTGAGSKPVRVAIRMENPITVTARDPKFKVQYEEFDTLAREHLSGKYDPVGMRKALLAKGYDGIIVPGSIGGAPTWRIAIKEGSVRVVETSGQKAEALQPELLPIDPEVINLAAERVIRNYADQWWQGIERTTREGLRQAIARSQRDGTGTQGVLDSIKHLFSPERAQAIAVTETTRLLGQGAVATYAAAGLDEWEWQTVEDKFVEDICRVKDKQRYPIATTFEPAHVSCRCFARPVMLEDEEKHLRGKHDQATHGRGGIPMAASPEYVAEIRAFGAAYPRGPSGFKPEAAYILGSPNRASAETDAMAEYMESKSNRESMMRALGSQVKWGPAYDTAVDEWLGAQSLGAHSGVLSTTKDALKGAKALSDSDIEAFSARTHFLQDKVREKYGDEIEVYRGVKGAQAKKIRDSGSSSVDLGVRGLSSFTTNARGARLFAGKSGVVLKTIVKSSEVFGTNEFGARSGIRFLDDHDELVILNPSPTRAAEVV